MKLILAQGNPGSDYSQTRHNVGFRALDTFAAQHHYSFQTKPRFHAEIAELTFEGEKVLLVKPTTFYNQTGECARSLCDFYKIPTNNLLVIHDDLSLPFGTIRIRESGSDAGNNGIKSLNAHIGQNYLRLRIGIGSDISARRDSADFVLARFSKDEEAILHETLLPKSSEIITDFLSNSHQITSYTI